MFSVIGLALLCIALIIFAYIKDEQNRLNSQRLRTALNDNELLRENVRLELQPAVDFWKNEAKRLSDDLVNQIRIKDRERARYETDNRERCERIKELRTMLENVQEDWSRLNEQHAALFVKYTTAKAKQIRSRKPKITKRRRSK